MRRAVHLDERHLALRAVVVNRARHHFLPGPGLARDENGALRFRHELRCVDDLLHAPAAADDAVVIELGIPFTDQIPVLGAQPLMVERPVHEHQQLVDLERLLQIIERSQLHRFDGAFDRGVRRHHQDLRAIAFRGRRHQFPDQIGAGEVRHQVVDHQHVEQALAEQALRLARAAGRHHFVSLASQRRRQGVQDFCFVVYEKDRTGGHEWNVSPSVYAGP